jgi:peptidoglycan/LPS O-acetylase OafA/YrhL
MLFFVLSGFLITGLLDREKLQTAHISLSTFYMRRILRLFPALFCFLAGLCLLIRLGVVTDTPLYTVVTCLIYVRNIWGQGTSTAHVWSLSIEEQFYMFWPWIMRALSRVAALWFAMAGVIAISVYRMVAIHLRWSDYGTGVGVFYIRSWYRFDSILIGCVIALWLCRSTNLGFQSYLSGMVLPAFLWPSVIVWTLWGEAVTHVWYLTVQMILAALILVHLLLSRETAYLAAFSHPVAGWFGRISYSWYLWQQLFTAFSTPTWHGLRIFPFNLIASLLIAVASYKWIERPFLRLKDRVSRRVRK